MSSSRQIALVVLILVVAGGGWFAMNGGMFGGGSEIAAAPTGAGNGQQQQQAQGGAQGQRPAGARQGGGAGGGPGGGQPAPVVTASVGVEDTGFEVQAVGTVAASRAVVLYPEGTGVVAEVLFDPGTIVQAGAPLIRLDDADQQVARERARIALDAAEVARDRAEQLAKSNNITTVALDEARSAVQRAEIDLRSAETDLQRRTLSAPFSGTIGLTDVTVGDLVNSQKQIATLDDMSTVTVAFNVPERASGMVTVGQPVSGTTEAIAGQVFDGAIKAIDSRVDPVARTLKVEASLPNEANVLKPGMALNVGIAFVGEDRPAVPSISVQWDRTGPYVWKVTDATVNRVGVEIVGRRSGTVIVAGDIAVGDQVVVEGLQRVRDGATVTVIGTDDTGTGDVPVPVPDAGEAIGRAQPPRTEGPT